MRKINSFLLAILALVAVVPLFIACENDDEVEVKQEPQITLTTDLEVGDVIVLRFQEKRMPTEVIGATKLAEEEINMDGGFFDAGVVNVAYILTSQTVIVKGNITHFRCWENGLTGLDVSRCPELELLQCDYNQLTTLNVSNNSALKYLFCSNNKLTQLNVSKNTELEVLSCSSNKIASLDTSKNTELEALYCHNNKLTSLDVGKNTELYDLDCHLNKIGAAEMSKIINALPDWTGKSISVHWTLTGCYTSLYAVSTESNEENEMSDADKKIAEEKNWKVH